MGSKAGPLQPSPNTLNKREDSQRLELVLDFPPSTNRMWRTTFRGRKPRTYKNPTAVSYSELVATKAQLQCLNQGWRPTDQATAVTMRFFFPTRAGDLSNRIKVVEDALNGIAWRDDKQTKEMHLFRELDRTRPRVEILVEVVTWPNAS